MLKQNQAGAVSGMLISLILAVLLLIAAAVFGGWAFSSRQDYKNNVDAKISTAVTTAKQQQTTVDNAQYAEEAKQPLTIYNGPEAYGSIVLYYPKTWSGYVNASGGSNNALVDGYFNPGIVPSISDRTSTFALRVQVLSTSYTQTLQTFTSAEQGGGSGRTPLVINPYALPKVPNVVGIEATGTLPNTQVIGTAVVLPLRTQTLEIWTMSSQYLSDFNNSILPNFSFSP